ncbi:MAG: polysaccharide biosynthesis/export family protein [Pseudomonadota bacterium]
MNNVRFTARVRALFLVVFLVVISGCGSGPDSFPPGEEVDLTSVTFAFDQEEYLKNTTYFNEYRIIPGDLLDILFSISLNQISENFKLAIDQKVTVKFPSVPDLFETQNVQPDGNITLPYIGRVYVVGKTIEQLTAELKKRYSVIFRDPELYVIVPEFSAALREMKQDLHTAPRGLSRLVTVRPDGYATFPMVGDLFVVGKTIPEINQELDAWYKKDVPGLHVTLFLEQSHGSVVYVMGEVAKSGAYPIERPISVFEALTLAGGHTENAKLGSVIIFRRRDHQVTATRLNMEGVLEMEPFAPYFYLKPYDLVYIPKTNIATAAHLMSQVGNIIWFRGWSLGMDVFNRGIIDLGPELNSE